MITRNSVLSLCIGCTLIACSEPDSSENHTNLVVENQVMTAVTSTQDTKNPFYDESPLYLNYPQFDKIENSHYLPAFERGMAEQTVEIDAITGQPAAVTFENTIRALELSGQLLARVGNVFFSLAGAHTNDDIRALQQQLAPVLAAHNDSILLNRALFARINSLYQQREGLELDAESSRLLQQYYVDFVRAGAALESAQQQRLKEINAQLAVLRTQFSQNVLSEVNEMAIVVGSREELTGLDEATISAAEEEAISRDQAGKYVIPLLNTSGQPALASLQNRSLREHMHRTSLSRGSRGGEFDNREILSNVLRLRSERAQLLGYETHADYILKTRRRRP